MLSACFGGVYSGDFTTSLYIAVFFELFWLDLIPAGTFLPPHLTAATFSALALTTYFGLEQPARIMGVLFASMPLAWLGAKVEAMLRDQARWSYNKLLNWSRHPEQDHVPAMLVARSLALTFLSSWVCFFVATMLLQFGFKIFFQAFPGVLSRIDVSWAHLWIAASLGGFMALRLSRVYAVLGTGIAIAVGIMIWGRF
ncbi:hypothetical protein [Pseudodesulfovibrio tunisiensis]|uniref:hypothetical protein n=1 Tax=Pseudodesulfovibrio tunisiensis TaxID=463192 RepID=UPI001FB363AC|nr:hypothetical protein [Pseudodesulfovibrio tunisiensis]